MDQNQMGNASEDMIIPCNPQDYQELQGLKEGAMVKFEGHGQLGSDGIKVMHVDFSPSDNEATNEWNKMAGKDGGGDRSAGSIDTLSTSGKGF